MYQVILIDGGLLFPMLNTDNVGEAVMRMFHLEHDMAFNDAYPFGTLAVLDIHNDELIYG